MQYQNTNTKNKKMIYFGLSFVLIALIFVTVGIQMSNINNFGISLTIESIESLFRDSLDVKFIITSVFTLIFLLLKSIGALIAFIYFIIILVKTIKIAGTTTEMDAIKLFRKVIRLTCAVFGFYLCIDIIANIYGMSFKTCTIFDIAVLGTIFVGCSLNKILRDNKKHLIPNLLSFLAYAFIIVASLIVSLRHSFFNAFVTGVEGNMGVQPVPTIGVFVSGILMGAFGAEILRRLAAFYPYNDGKKAKNKYVQVRMITDCAIFLVVSSTFGIMCYLFESYPLLKYPIINNIVIPFIMLLVAILSLIAHNSMLKIASPAPTQYGAPNAYANYPQGYYQPQPQGYYQPQPQGYYQPQPQGYYQPQQANYPTQPMETPQASSPVQANETPQEKIEENIKEE